VRAAALKSEFIKTRVAMGDRLDPAMMEELEKKAEKKKQKTAERMIRALKKHPVMEEDIDFKGKFGLDLTDQRVLDLKKIFAIADYSGRMSIGRKQFVDLMKMLGIDPTDVRAVTCIALFASGNTLAASASDLCC